MDEENIGRPPVYGLTGTEKYWSGLCTFFIEIDMFLRVCHFIDPASRGANIKCMTRQLWGMLCL